jgi:biotin carboxyl carrier protein
MFHVESGVQVEENEVLCEIEVMKTLHRVHSPCAGVLTWTMGLGEVVGEGEVLGEIV